MSKSPERLNGRYALSRAPGPIDGHRLPQSRADAVRVRALDLPQDAFVFGGCLHARHPACFKGHGVCVCVEGSRGLGCSVRHSGGTGGGGVCSMWATAPPTGLDEARHALKL